MHHLNHIEKLYRKKLLNKLHDLDVLTYQNKFKNRIDQQWVDRLDQAEFTFSYNGTRKDIIELVDYVRNNLTQHNLLIWNAVTFRIPLYYISFDGTFALKLKNLFDEFTLTYLLKKQDKSLSYFILFDRSDVCLQARVYSTSLDPFSEIDASAFMLGLKERIREGYFRNIPWQKNELETRELFWDSLNLLDIRVKFDNPGSRVGQNLPGMQYYNSYLEIKKGFYPDANEVFELKTIHYNKLLPDIFLVGYECRDRLYGAETLEDIYNFYVSLGLQDVRFIGSGVFEIQNKNDFCDIILRKEKWKDIETVDFEKFYINYKSLANWLGFFVFRRISGIRGIIKEPLENSVEEKLLIITEWNIITDPTMDVRPKFRHPVTYDYFTTPRLISYTMHSSWLQVCIPLVDLTEETKSLIQKKAEEWGYVLTENIEEDEYFRYKEFYIKKHHEETEKTSKAQISEQRGDIQESIRLMGERDKELDNLSKREGIRRNLNLKEDETIR